MLSFIYLVLFLVSLQLLLQENVVRVNAGVVGLTKFLRRKGSGSAWTPASINQQATTDHLCIDMNQLIHTSVRSKSTPNLNQCSRRIFFELDNILKYVSPKKSLVLVFDGPAPFAKLQTQRSRRVVSPESNIITPGTDFMALVESLMLSYAFSRVNRLRNVTVYISGTTAPGEGEVKIIDWATTHITNRNESLVVCGLDSDILVQGIMLSRISQIRVLQLGKDYSAAFCNISLVIDNLALAANLTDPKLLNVSTDRFTREDTNRDLYLESIANGNIPAKPNSFVASLTQFQLESIVRHGLRSRKPDSYLAEYPKSFGLDLIALFVMQGNDYLPKVRGVTMDRALLAYGNVMKLLPPENRCLLDTERNSFNFVALYLLMQELRCDSVQLHVQVPRPVSCLYELAQRQDLQCDMEWQDEVVESVEPPSSRTQLWWRTSLTVNGVNISSSSPHPSKAAARDALARQILVRWAPEALNDMNRRRAQAQATLREYKSSVRDEERAQFESLRELVESDGDTPLWDTLSAHFNDNSRGCGDGTSSSGPDSADALSEKDIDAEIECVDDNGGNDNGMVTEEGYARYVR